MASATERVVAGSAELDRWFGSEAWRSQISLRHLNLGDACECILGQLFEDFFTAPAHLRLNAVAFGFEVEPDVTGDTTSDLTELHDAWVTELS